MAYIADGASRVWYWLRSAVPPKPSLPTSWDSEEQMQRIEAWIQHTHAEIQQLRGIEPFPLVTSALVDSFIQALMSMDGPSGDRGVIASVCRQYFFFCEVLFQESLHTLDLINHHFEYWRDVSRMGKYQKLYHLSFKTGPHGFLKVFHSLLRCQFSVRGLDSFGTDVHIHLDRLNEMRMEVAGGIGLIHKYVYDLLKCTTLEQVFSVLTEGMEQIKYKLENMSAGKSREVDVTPKDLNATITNLGDSLGIFKERVATIRARVLLHRKPSHFEQSWLKYGFVGFGVLVGSRFMLKRSDVNGRPNIENWIHQGQDACSRFYIEHVKEPIGKLSEFFFNTYRSRPSIITPEEFRESQESLSRMVRDFLTTVPQGVALSTDQIEALAQNGNMEFVMKRYESELANPLKGAISGELIRAFLIQVQKLKIDTQSAMLSMDQILKSNELNIELLAAIPAVTVIFGAGYGFNSIIATYRQRERSRIRLRLRFAITEIDRITQNYPTFRAANAVNQLMTNEQIEFHVSKRVDNSVEIQTGLLLHHLEEVYICGSLLVTEMERRSFFKDVSCVNIFMGDSFEQRKALNRILVTNFCFTSTIPNLDN